MEIKKNKAVVKWVILGIAIIAIGVGGFFGYKAYSSYLVNKIYAVNDTVKLSAFDITVTKAEFKPVDLPLGENTAKAYGDLEVEENCDVFSTSKNWEWTGRGIAVGMDGWDQNGPSDHQLCTERNQYRNATNSYAKNNQQLVANYEISARQTVNTKDFSASLVIDSGRNPNQEVDSLKGNPFFKAGAYELKPETVEGVTHRTYSYFSSHKHSYKPYYASKVGGDINKGLERKGTIYTDIRSDEQSVDLKIKYKDEVRIIRIEK